MWGDPTNPAHYPEGPFDIVYDNNGKDLETCQPLIDHFKVGTGWRTQAAGHPWADGLLRHVGVHH